MPPGHNLPEEVTQVCANFQWRLEESLPSLQGIYIYGSAATSDFDFRTSDIDFLVLLASAPNSRDIAAIAAAHRELAREQLLARRLDGEYAAQDNLARLEEEHLAINDGSLIKRRLPVVARHQLRMHSVMLLGSSPVEVIPEVTQAEIANEMHANLTGYWTSKLDERRVWLSDEFLDFAVTTLPRIAYTLETGEIISKRQAINWLGRVNHEWHRFAVAVHTRRASGSTPRFYRLALDAHKTRRLVRAFIRLYAKKS